MSVPARYQGGVILESTFATYAAPTRFFEVVSDQVVPQYARIESAALRSGKRGMRTADFVPYILGAQGDINMEVRSKGFGYWLQFMLGSVATTGPTDAKYTHTGTLGSLTGKSFTWQGNRPFHPADTDQPFNFKGGKVISWELSNSAEGLLMLKLSCDFADVDTSNALAAVSYPSGVNELYSFVGGVVTVGGSQFDVTDASVSLDNGLKVDRRYLRSSPLKKEQVEANLRTPTFALTADFSDLTQLNRVSSATAAGAYAAVVLTWQAPTLIGAASLPTIVVTLPAARFDEGFPAVSGSDPLTQAIKGKALDAGAGAISIAYGTADVTP